MGPWTVVWCFARPARWLVAVAVTAGSMSLSPNRSTTCRVGPLPSTGRRISGRPRRPAVFTGLTINCLAIKLAVVRARDVNRIIESRGGEHVRTVESYKRYRVIGNNTTTSTAVPQHPGDIPTGTLRKIQKDLEPALGRKWLL